MSTRAELAFKALDKDNSGMEEHKNFNWYYKIENFHFLEEKDGKNFKTDGQSENVIRLTQYSFKSIQ
jgi:hypothetical protein